MIKIEAKRIPFYFFIFIIVLIISTFGKKLTDIFDRSKTEDEYELIRKYLLNDSSFGNNKPKLWIHSKFMNRSQVCKSNESTSSSELEHPYINLTVESIVECCHNDFNICLIDDDSFSKLIPEWDSEINSLPDPHKKNHRDLGMATLYIYGGIIVPNSFVCLKSLKQIYEENTSSSKPFVGEFVNNKNITLKNNKRIPFIPDSTLLIGAKKDDIVIKEMVEHHKKNAYNPHFSTEHEFKGKCNEWCLNMISLNRIIMIDGQNIGTKTIDTKPITLEDLMEDKSLSLNPDCVGIYIPHEEMMKRTKYQWFTVSSVQEVVSSKTAIAKYLEYSRHYRPIMNKDTSI
jgi:hypothetical protein